LGFEFQVLGFEFRVLGFTFSGNFILQITVHSDLTVIFAVHSVFKFANSILRHCNENTELEQLISYDTTFCLGDFYLSVLVMRNIFIEGDPIFSVLFMVHERKFKTLHIRLELLKKFCFRFIRI
jgi:hypothetical protein